MKSRQQIPAKSSNPCPEDERLLDVRAAAELLGMKASTLYQWVSDRRIPVVKLFGKSVRFRRSVLLKLIADSERNALRTSRRDERDTSEDRDESGSSGN
jgi:excisionase family DNA binding protein